MSQLLVDDIVNKDDTGAPGLSKGVIVTGITSSTSAVIGTGVTINSTGIDVGVGIMTATTLDATTVNATTLDATTVNATTLTGSGANLTGLPAGFNWVDGSLF
jgi:hypothetical protein